MQLAAHGSSVADRLRWDLCYFAKELKEQIPHLLPSGPTASVQVDTCSILTPTTNGLAWLPPYLSVAEPHKSHIALFRNHSQPPISRFPRILPRCAAIIHQRSTAGES